MRKRLRKKRYKKALKVARMMKRSLMKVQEAQIMEMFARSYDLLYPPELIHDELETTNDMHMKVRSSLLGVSPVRAVISTEPRSEDWKSDEQG